MDSRYDVIVAGGGPVGSALAIALSGGEASVLHLRGPALRDRRPVALSHGSRVLLERLRVWQGIESTPIQAIHVSQQGGFGRTLIRAADCRLPALGYVAPYSGVLEALSGSGLEGRILEWRGGDAEIEALIDCAEGERKCKAKLLVLADGAGAVMPERGHDYGQSAVVAEVLTERHHEYTAWERFTPAGPLALLPSRDRYALVWCVEKAQAGALAEAGEAHFLARLQAAFGSRLGAFTAAQDRGAFPLALRYREVSPSPRLILAGNAAQTLHPVAGQGLNLGLRDVAVLAALIEEASRDEIGTREFLRRYARRRSADRRLGIGFTDALVRVFSNSSRALSIARGAGLACLDVFPPGRLFLARRMIFGARGLP